MIYTISDDGWIRSVVGDALASVSQDPGTGAVTVLLHTGTPQERAREVEARLRAGGYDRGLFVDYTVRVAHEATATTREHPCQVCGLPTWHLAACSEECAFEHGKRSARCAREAALVALVAAVPEGLDANGWRAAVLAAAEKFTKPHRYQGIPSDGWRERLACCLSHEVGLPNPPTWKQAWNGPYVSGARLDAIAAYRRAVQPPPARPAPHRRRAPGLPLDMGEG